MFRKHLYIPSSLHMVVCVFLYLINQEGVGDKFY